MAEELQQLLNRINDDYLKKAESEKDTLIANAKDEAAKIIAAAEAAAEARKAEAEAAAAGFQARAEAAAKQAARDVVLALHAELQARMERAVGQAAAGALTPEFMAGIIQELAAAFIKSPDGEVTVLASVRESGKLADALRGSLSESFKVAPQVFPNAGIRNGMQVSFNGSDVYFDFTDAAVRELLKSYLGAELGKLFDGEEKK